MRTRFWRIAGAAAICLIALWAVSPVMAHADTSQHYYLELYEYPQGGFPTSGTLDLTFHNEGTITGFYYPSDGGVAAISGSLNGTVMQLDFGGPVSLHIDGTMKNGAIVGRGFRSFGNQLYSFRLLPIPNGHTLPKVTPIPWPHR